MPGSDQAWVTLALDDSQSLRSLVLARSLRRVITSKKLAVIASQDVSDSMRSLLEDEFDVVINVGLDSANTKGLPSSLFAKLYSWKLTFFNKCVFLDPNAWVLQNCDEIFDWDELSATADQSRANCFEPSVFVLQPSFQTFNAIANFVKTTGFVKENGLDILNMFFKDWSKSGERVLPSDFNMAISSSTTFDQFSSNLKIARFSGINPLLDNHEKVGSRTQYYDILAQTWMNIFNDDIHPKLASAMKLDPNLKLNGYKLHPTPTALSKTGFSKDDHSYLSDSVAIVGLSCRFPGANSAEEFWELLAEGKDAIQEVPVERWDKYPKDDDTIGTKAGFLKCPIDEFDAKFFGVSPREAAFTDPQQRLLLEVAWEGLENAGINPLALKGTNTGVFMGVWAADYERMLRSVARGADAHRIYLGNAYSAISARVSFFLGLDGPNIATESGCSSSSVSLHLACESLRRKECNLAIAGGVNLLIQAFPLVGPAKPVFLSPDGHCKTFDEKADGFGRAEGCGVVVLKRYTDAQRDGDRILAIVRGSAVNSEGTTANFGAPSKNCQAKVIKEALKNSRVEPAEVSYVEAHGTGTMVGDPIEVAAIASGYSEGRKDPLVIGSVKTNIGHTEGAAGMAGLIKVVMAMQNETIPPHCNLEKQNPNINFDVIPAIVPLKPTPWKKEENKKRIAGISSFGISGTNVHVVVEEPPIGSNIKPQELEIERPHHILTLSAKNEDALAELIVKYQSFLKNNPELKIEDVAYTANTGRAHFPHRLAVIGKDAFQIQTRLEKRMYAIGRTAPQKPQIAFLFTGQGSQYIGMAKRLYHTHPIFKRSLDRCANLLHNNLGISLLNVIWNENSGDTHSLDQTVYSQTSIFCIEYSLLQLWKSFGINPHYVLGHSVGEFAAATAAGILTLEEAIHLVAERSRLIQSMPKGGMLAVKSSPENVRKLLDEFMPNNPGLWLDIAVINSTEEVVVAGRHNSLDAFTEECTNLGIKTLRVAATHAFHSREMEGIMEEFGKMAEGISYKAPQCGYVSGRDGRLLEKEDINSKYWQQHARENVDFTAGIKTLFNRGVRTFVEIGPHPILLALGMTNVSPQEAQESTWLPSIRKNDDEWVTLLSSLARLYIKGVDISWKDFDGSFSRKKLELPTYPFQRQKYWFDFDVAGREMVLTTKIQHPLLGRPAPLVSSSEINVNVFQQSIDLEYLPYLSDHQVANKVILPGAGFLEMILAAGNLSVQGTDGISILDSGAPITIEDFMIEAPLELGVEEGVHLQFLAAPRNLDAPGELNISVFKRLNAEEADGNNKWKRYAIAKFTTVVSQTQENLKQCGLDTIKNRCLPEISTEELYKRVPELGICFGPTFQSIRSFWKGSNEVIAEIPAPQDAGNLHEYIGHPVVLDAMIQAFALTMDEESKSLYLPIGCDKFICFARCSTKTMYAHTTWENPENRLKGNIRLYDENGVHLAIMEGVRIVRTTVTAFLNALTSRKKALPGLYHETWNIVPGTVASRVKMDVIPENCILNDKMKEKMEELDKFYVATDIGKRVLERLVFLQIVKTFYQLNWCPKLDQLIHSREFLVDHLIAPKHLGLVELYFSILVEEGILSRATNPDTEITEWTVIQLPVSHTDIDDAIEAVIMEYKGILAKGKEGEGIGVVDYLMLRRVGEYLPAVLQNRVSGLNVLFPEEDEGAVSATQFYNESKMYCSSNEVLPQIFEEFFGHLSTKSRNPNEVLRILEIGAGIGSTTEFILPTLIKLNIPFHYTFTDISPLFLSKAKERFEKYGNYVSYKLLNIEMDPKLQGHAPHQFDVVVAANVMHATEYLSQSVAHARHLMVPNGKLLLNEPFTQFRMVHMMFGILEGWWRFKDFDVRPESPLAGVETWNKILTSNGFHSPLMLPTYGYNYGCMIASATNDTPLLSSLVDNQYWVIFADEDQDNKLLPPLKKQFEENSQKIIIVRQGEAFTSVNDTTYTVNPTTTLDFKNLIVSIQEKNWQIDGFIYLWGYQKSIEEFNQEKICGGLLHLIQGIIGQKLKTKAKLLVVTSGVSHIGDQTAGNPSAGTLLGLTKTICASVPDVKPKYIDLDPDENDYYLNSRSIFDEIWINDEEFQMAYRQNKRQVVRFTTIPPIPSPLSLPNSERYKLILPESKSIADLTLGPMAKQELKPEEIEVLVKSVGLNFRDIFVIMRPDTYDSKYDAVGTDFSGIVSAVGADVTKYKIGDEVFGVSEKGAIASHVVTHQLAVIKKPKHLTHYEAAGYPSVYLTAYYCLINIAGLKAGENVLIHSAAGGVGLAAVHIAKHFGAEIIATAGNRRKRNLLKSLGIKYVFNSRTTNYGQEIEKELNGCKIHVVLNALTSAGFKEASLHICKTGARFVEMGKVGIWQPEEVKELRPDVAYSIVDLEKVDMSGAGLMDTLSACVNSPKEKVYLPVTRYELSHLIHAFNYFQTGQHIGKICIAMPDLVLAKGKVEAIENLFNDSCTYLITGGLGGIGLEVAKWMVSVGAKNIVLIGRSAPTPKVRDVLDEFNSQGKNVISRQCDVGDFQHCQELMNWMKSFLPPLKGIMHAAGALADAMLNNQTWSKFHTVFNAKVSGAWNLHHLTKDYHLDHFILYSSIAGIFGSFAQPNHAAANIFLDCLANYRTSLGLPTQSINWGLWGDVGVAADTNLGKSGGFGIKPFNVAQGIAALKAIMVNHLKQTAVLEIDMLALKQSYSNFLGNYFEVLIAGVKDLSTGISSAEAETFWQEIKEIPQEERAAYIKGHIEMIIRQTLKMSEAELIDEHQSFSEMGMDSLMAVEMRNRLQLIFGKYVTLNATSLLDYPTVSKLSIYLVDLVNSIQDTLMEEEAQKKKDSVEDLKPEESSGIVDENLIRTDSILPAHIKSHGEYRKVSELKSIFLTGATGQLGIYVLNELTKLAKLKIVCLIRSRNAEDGRKRLLQKLKKYDLHKNTNLDNVEVVSGNIAEKYLGLSESAYTKLSLEMHAVIHCAVKANHVDRYEVVKSSTNDMRSVNVFGTINVLQFAGEGITKQVLHASSLVAYHRITDDGYLVEEFPDDDDYGSQIKLGYPMSKFICEKLVKEAISRGIPCRAVRFPTIVGHSETGRFSPETNHLMLFMLACMHIGKTPQLGGSWSSIPVDSSAKLLLKIFFSDKAESGVYNITNPFVTTQEELIGVQKELGFNTTIVSHEEWTKALEEKGEKSLLYPLRDIYLKDDGFFSMIKASPVTEMAFKDNHQLFALSEKVKNIVGSIDNVIPHNLLVFRRHVEFAQRTNVFKMFDLE